MKSMVLVSFKSRYRGKRLLNDPYSEVCSVSDEFLMCTPIASGPYACDTYGYDIVFGVDNCTNGVIVNEFVKKIEKLRVVDSVSVT